MKTKQIRQIFCATEMWKEYPDGVCLASYTTQVGVETWGLSYAPERYVSLGNSIDVAGAHNYVSGDQPDFFSSIC